LTHDHRNAACPDADTLAAFAEGKLRRHEMPAILAHLDTCERCMAAIEAVNEDLETAEPQLQPESSNRWWIAAAAALIVGLLAVPLARERFAPSPIDELVALAPRSARLVEPRLTGGFAWAAFAGAERGSDTVDAERMKLSGAAGELVQRADRERDADAQHAAGVALVLADAPAAAIARLEQATAASNDAQTWSDLAAARYAAASQLGRASLYPAALAAADAALRVNAKLPEALFNRALILERLGLTDEARRAWQRYLEVDPASQWAQEARARLAELAPASRSSRFERERPLLELAAARSDAVAVRSAVDAHRDRARAYAETEYLNRWGEAVGRGDVADAGRWLSIARGIGSALADVSGESLTRDAVRAIDSASPADRTAMAAAHVAYRTGRLAYSRHELDVAQRALSTAATAFATAHHPMALAARYYGASVRLARNETSLARAELERARVDADAHPGFINLGARVRWELGRACMLDDDWPAAVAVLGDGAAMFRRAGERASEAFVESMLARALAGTGRGDEAWLARIRGFSALSAEGERALLATALQEAMHVEALAGRRDAAAALSALALDVAESAGDAALVVDVLSTQALLLSTTGPAMAVSAARRARELAGTTPDPERRARLIADVDAATGAALATSDPRAASESLTRAIDFYARHELHFALPAPLLLRARCATRLGQRDVAARDLERGMSIIERRREASDSASTPDVFDAEHALFTDAIEAALDRGDNAAAFAFAERSRRATIGVAELQQRLRGSGVAVIEIVALPSEVITFALSENDFAVSRRERTAEALAALGDAAVGEPRTAAASQLYDDVIRPVEHVLAGAREIVIVPDAALRATPFAGLYDSSAQRYLIERFAVSTASSAASLRRVAASTAAPSLATIEVGASAGAAALPEAAREIGEITATYASAQTIRSTHATIAALHAAAASADVLHIAGHTERQSGGGEQALMLKDGAVSWKTIVAAPRMKSDVIVLAACETLRPPASSATHGRSLGEAFASAGASDVFGTLAPIGDRDARLLFGALHRHLATGVQPAHALQSILREAIAADRDGRHAWRAVAMLTTRIAVHPGK
jgi:hypothetical protein